jgi:hypothetical protein
MAGRQQVTAGGGRKRRPGARTRRPGGASNRGGHGGAETNAAGTGGSECGGTAGADECGGHGRAETNAAGKRSAPVVRCLGMCSGLSRPAREGASFNFVHIQSSGLRGRGSLRSTAYL